LSEVIVVGAGIIGLAHALAAVHAGARVTVVDRDARANGASIRNFGFITVTGQERGRVWGLARRSARIWREVAGPAGIAIEQQGLLVVGQRPEALPVLDAFMATEMATGCTRLTAAQVTDLCPQAVAPAGAIHSHHDLRVEPREALPKLAAWLATAHGVRFRFGSAVVGVESGRVALANGEILAGDAIIVCPGDDWATLFPAIYAEEAITRCKLQMLRLPRLAGAWLPR
jgi:FAD dependent oxidoreductase TIGR03364